MQPWVVLQLPTLQTSPTGQTTAVPPQAPLVQVSGDVHALLSLQVVPSAALVKPQPATTSQLATLQAAVAAGQVMVLPPQTPAVQTSFEVQALLSLQGLLSTLVSAQPVAATQVAVWQALPAGQTTSVCFTQT